MLGSLGFSSVAGASALVSSLAQGLEIAERMRAEGREVPEGMLRSANLLLEALRNPSPRAGSALFDPSLTLLPPPLPDKVAQADFEPVLRDWRESVASEIAHNPEEAQAIFRAAADEMQRHGLYAAVGDQLPVTPQTNTIPAAREIPYPGGAEALRLEKSLLRSLRWNAAMMVDGANERHPGLGGHIGTYASSADFIQTFLLHFFRGKSHPEGADHLFIQGHDSPGFYAFDHLLGGLTDEQLKRFRREVGIEDPRTGAVLIDAGRGEGLSSYPHTFLMPEKWEFHSVSMGLANQLSIHLARANRWLRSQGLKTIPEGRVWGIFGDGSAEEPESQADLHLAAVERLPVRFLFNCNLQRLDGPVRGNGSVLLELESRYRAAGWKVIKVLTGGAWDDLLARDTHGLIARRMAEVTDGQFQTYQVKGGAYFREHFFGLRGPHGREQPNPDLAALAGSLTDEDVSGLLHNWGGHDPVKIYNALREAEATDGPAVVLFRTVKGRDMGEYEAAMAIHGVKHLKKEQRLALRDRLGIPLSDEEAGEDFRFHRPEPDSEELEYLRSRRLALGGPFPQRIVPATPHLEPPASLFQAHDKGSGGREVSTTMVWMKLWYDLMNDPANGRFFTQIGADEYRTFGGESHIARFGIYSPSPQSYLSADHAYQVRYKEGPEGRIWQVGISEAAAISLFTSLATMYATHGVPIVPSYIFYSKFGFQRIGDQIWGAGDMRARGFLVGATAGRTTLNGEGLQHEDGESPLFASAYPSVRAYDPAFSYELAAIAREGIRRFFGGESRQDQIFYLTVYNENRPMPARPEGVTDEMILGGLYPFDPAEGAAVQILGSGTILFEALRARDILAERFGVRARVWSATSYPELAREAERTEHWNRNHPSEPARKPLVTRLLENEAGPVIAVSDYVKALPRLVSGWIPQGLTALGTDGYGRSDTRSVLRRFFGIDAASIALAALERLSRQGRIPADTVVRAQKDFGFDPERPSPIDLDR